MASTYDDDWRPTARDMHLLNTGRKPAWAKKVTEIGPREKRLRTSNAPSEIAMRRVTEPDYHPPFSETDLKNVRKGETMMNQRIADAIARKVDLKVDANADGISVADLSKTPVRFFIWSHGLDYVVKIIRSATDHDAIRCKSIKDVVDVINKNTIGEAMNVNKAKQILEQAGYVIENPQINEEFDAKDVYLTKAVNIFLKDNPGWLEEFTKEELLEVFGARSDIDDYIGEVPPGVFAEEMEDIDLFQNCAEKAGF